VWKNSLRQKGLLLFRFSDSSDCPELFTRARSKTGVEPFLNQSPNAVPEMCQAARGAAPSAAAPQQSQQSQRAPVSVIESAGPEDALTTF